MSAGLTIHRADRLAIDESWGYNLAVISPFWRLYANAEAGAGISWRDGAMDIEPHRAYLIPAWFRFDCHCQAEIDHMFAHFDPAWSSSTALLSEQRPLALPADHALTILLQEQRQRLSEPCSTDLIHSHWQAICQLASAYALGQAQQRPEPVHLPAAIHHILATIDAMPVAQLRVSLVADALHISPDHLTRLFRQHLDQPPSEYLRQRRIAHAAELLLGSDHSISEVAEQCGFANRYHFSRVFRTILHCGPASYRRRHS